MRRPIAAVAAAAVVWLPAPPSAHSFTDITPVDSGIVFCPADLGGGAALAWLRFGETSGGRDTLDLAATGLDPAIAPAELVPAGGCPVTATAPSGASLVALNLTGFTEEQGEVIVVDRAADGTASAPLRLNRNERSKGVAAALASNGAALVAWQEETGGDADTDPVTSLRVAARDAGGAFVALGVLDTEGRAPALGIDEAGYGIAVWSRVVPSVGNAARLVVATRAPAGAFSTPRDVGTTEDADSMSLVVGRSGEALLAVSDDSGVRLGAGTTRTGIGPLRRLGSAATEGVTATLGPGGAAAVAWRQPPDQHAPRGGVAVSDRAPGGDFGAPHALVTPGTRLGGNRAANLRLAAAPDGRILASWAVIVNAGDQLSSPVPVAALRRADGGWNTAVPLAAPCREQVDAFPGFDAAGRPRVTFVDSGLVSGGDYAFPYDTRIRMAWLDAVPATPGAPPRVTISANRRQVLRDDKLKLRVRCARACDTMIFAVIGRRSGTSSGVFPGYPRLPAKRTRTVTLAYESYFDDAMALRREGAIVKVQLVAHACDSFGRIARARRTIYVRIPRTRG